MKTVDILMNITMGFQARMLLRSSISRTLLEKGVHIVVCSPNCNEEYFRKEFKHPQITLEEMPAKYSRLEANAITLRQYLLMNPALGKTLNYKNEAFRVNRPFKYKVTSFGNAFLGRIAPLRKAYMRAEEILFPGREFDPILDAHRPDLVVTGTPGFLKDDIHLLRASKRKGIPTASVMLSWDNLTSKGYMNGIPDYLLVWSDTMAQEAVQYHDYDPENIIWCGAAQFDHYHDFRQKFDPWEWRRANNIPDDAHLIVYGAINPAILPHEISILREITDAIKSGRFKHKCFLWIRLHPQVVKGPYSLSLEPFMELAGPQVKVEIPPVQSEKLQWDLPKEDAQHLASLLAASEACISPGSTLFIDGACVGTPSIMVLFDGAESVPEALSVRRFDKYTHMEKLIKKGVNRAHDLDELVEIVDNCIEYPEKFSQGPRNIVRQQLNRLDGKAGYRAANILFEIASGKSPNPSVAREYA